MSKMNDWDTIEKLVNTLPQWDVIKLIIGIQEELKCAKEDNLYQLRQNKNLQNRIDKALDFIDCHFKEMVADEEAQELKSILKESGE